MTVWKAVRRATLLIPSGPPHDPARKHLYIVLNDPFPDAAGKEMVLVVCVVSIPASNKYDPSCTLFPAEHPFVVHHSYIAYNYATMVDPLDLEAKVQKGEFVAKPLLDEKVYAYVIEGLRDSPHLAPRFLRYFERTLPQAPE